MIVNWVWVAICAADPLWYMFEQVFGMLLGSDGTGMVVDVSLGWLDSDG